MHFYVRPMSPKTGSKPMEEKLTISLSPTQRDLLLTYEPYFSDPELFRLISMAVKEGDSYEIMLDEDQLEDLYDQVCDIFDIEDQDEQTDQLDELCDYLEEFREYEDDYEDEGDDSEYSNNTGAVCILKVALAGTDQIWRKIAIREGQTLHELHDMIFEAFDREEDHMYSFFFPRFPLKKMNPRVIYQSSDEYTHPVACEDPGPFGSEAKDASNTTLQSLDLLDGEVFYYLFDFGDEWWHEIRVEQADGTADEGEYPRIIERKGTSPDQYENEEDD